jgi:hypothetical protein
MLTKIISQFFVLLSNQFTDQRQFKYLNQWLKPDKIHKFTKRFFCYSVELINNRYAIFTVGIRRN